MATATQTRDYLCRACKHTVTVCGSVGSRKCPKCGTMGRWSRINFSKETHPWVRDVGQQPKPQPSCGEVHVCRGCGQRDTTAASQLCGVCTRAPGGGFAKRECRTGVRPANPLYEDYDQ